MVTGSQGESDGRWCRPECDGCLDRDLQIASMDLEVQLTCALQTTPARM